MKRKQLYSFFRRKVSMFMIAYMLGVSNIILDEDRMINDTKANIELVQKEYDFKDQEG